MSLLDEVTETQKQILISLPYRVGLWISKSDTTGGSAATQQELQVLSNIINGFTEEVFGSELMQFIMSATVDGQDRWPDWAENLASVPDDCALAVDVLRQHAGEKDAHAFQVHMMEIGTAVALAFREYEHMGPLERLMMYVSYFTSGAAGRKTLEEFLAVSRAERKALNTLAGALGTTYI